MTSTQTDVTAPLVTDEMLEQYRNEGYFILERALDDQQLGLLRSGAQYSVEKLDAAMDDAGVDRIGINARGKRYFSNFIYQDRPELREFLFGDTMAEICRAVLGDEAYMFWEQYVIKAGDPDTSFAWHQDSGYVHEDHEPYLTVWIALDDVTEENGSVYLLPYSRSGIRSYIKHIADPVTNDQVCYFGSDPGLLGQRPGGVDRGVLQRPHPPQRREQHRPDAAGLPRAVLPGGHPRKGQHRAPGFVREVPRGWPDRGRALKAAAQSVSCTRWMTVSSLLSHRLSSSRSIVGRDVRNVVSQASCSESDATHAIIVDAGSSITSSSPSTFARPRMVLHPALAATESRVKLSVSCVPGASSWSGSSTRSATQGSPLRSARSGVNASPESADLPYDSAQAVRQAARTRPSTTATGRDGVMAASMTGRSVAADHPFGVSSDQ